MGNCLSSEPRSDSAAAAKPASASGGVTKTMTDVVLPPTSVLAKQYFLFSRLPDPNGGAVRAGATWIAREKSTTNMAVLRVLQLPLDPGLVPLVCREVEALAPALLNSHPNVIPAKTLVLTAEHLALVAAPPFGRQDNKLHTLDEHAAVSRKVSNKPGLNMEESAALYFFIQILAGMEYFHSKKLAHLNMDLSTMVLDKSVNPPRLQLMDRGFAKSWRVANDLTYSRQKWITGSKKYCSLSDSIVDMNRSVKGSRTPGDSRRGSQDALASLNASWQSGKGVTSNAGGGMGCGAVHDVKSSRNSQELGGFDSVDKLSKIARDSAASSGSDPDMTMCCGSEAWDLDTVMGCSFDSAQAVDVFSCGCCLFALLMGVYPQSLLQRQIDADPSAAAAEIHKQMVLGWSDFPAAQKRYASLSGECQDLLLHMLTSVETERITMPDIKAHPWVTRDPGAEYTVALNFIGRRSSVGDRSNTAKALALSKQSAGILHDLKKKICETVWHAANMDSGLSPKEIRSISVGEPYGSALKEFESNCLGNISEAGSFSAGITSADAASLNKLLGHNTRDPAVRAVPERQAIPV
mmetsp:Transcript_7646/g.19696  ORF Transcript_7646/g.19696 Transcript_7646/m.19696 type:complete len:579 (-) Transcript_7646:236-1972(-)